MANTAHARLTPPQSPIANPAVVYAAIWLVVLGLFSLRLTAVLLPLNRSTVSLVLWSVGLGLGLACCLYLLLPRLRPYQVAREVRELEQLFRWRRRALAVWAVASLGEMVFAGGLPIVWLALGDTSKDYRNFGIPTLHGLLTALYLFAVAATAVEIFLCGRPRRWWGLLALLVWPVLQVNRGALIWALFQVAAVYLLCRRVRTRMAVGVAAGVLAGVLLFGVIGDLRVGTNREGLRDMVTDQGGVLVETLPSGFLWVYLYATTPINNIVQAIDVVEPVGTLYFSAIQLMPTVIREVVYTDPNKKFPLGLANEAFNTSTWFVNFIADFGPRGALAATALFQLIALLFYRSARMWRPWALVGYSACFQGIALSAFADTFTSLVAIAQMLLAVALMVAASRAAAGKGRHG
jgi:oligosaccharide repeat unit polymerase